MVIWDVVVFALGFACGAGGVVGILTLGRLRRQARREGDQLIASLGPVASRRFIEAVRD